uniref:Putative secreted peptide n=1 Tax=Anopheles braziliensis TaxID=58242 RepID=A0A2M3ZTE1_9DIPT
MMFRDRPIDIIRLSLLLLVMDRFVCSTVTANHTKAQTASAVKRTIPKFSGILVGLWSFLFYRILRKCAVPHERPYFK